MKKFFFIFFILFLFPLFAFGIVEDFSTYTEVDPNSLITVTPTKVTGTLQTRNHDAYVYYDKGVDYFGGDFEHYLTLKWTETNLYDFAGRYGLFNEVDAINAIWGNTGRGLAVYVQEYPDETRLMYLREDIKPTGYLDTYAISLNTSYYLIVTRDESVGTYGVLTCEIYSDSARTNLLDTLSVTLHEKTNFRYVFAHISGNWGDTYAQSGYTENLDLDVDFVPDDPISTATSSIVFGLAGGFSIFLFVFVGVVFYFKTRYA